VAHIDSAMDNHNSSSDVIEAVTSAFAWAIEHDAQKHRLWYDIRSQSLFEEAFRPVVREIEDQLIALVDRILTQLGRPTDNRQTSHFCWMACFGSTCRQHWKGMIRRRKPESRHVCGAEQHRDGGRLKDTPDRRPIRGGSYPAIITFEQSRPSALQSSR